VHCPHIGHAAAAVQLPVPAAALSTLAARNTAVSIGAAVVVVVVLVAVVVAAVVAAAAVAAAVRAAAAAAAAVIDSDAFAQRRQGCMQRLQNALYQRLTGYKRQGGTGVHVIR